VKIDFRPLTSNEVHHLKRLRRPLGARNTAMVSAREEFLDTLRSISRNGHEDLAVAWLHAHDAGTREPDIPDDLKKSLVSVLEHDRVSPAVRYEDGFSPLGSRKNRRERKSVVLLEMMKKTRESSG
jgi:hypothetical protein